MSMRGGDDGWKPPCEAVPTDGPAGKSTPIGYRTREFSGADGSSVVDPDADLLK